MELFIFWFGLCIAVAILASKRGRSGFGWFLFSLILSPLLGLIFVLILDKKNGQDAQDVSAPATSLRNCPECKELIRKDARKCKHCGSEVIPLVESFAIFSERASKFATQIYQGGGDISDYINLVRELGHECNQRGVLNTTFEVRVNSQVINFDDADSFKEWVNEKLVTRVIAREEIAL